MKKKIKNAKIEEPVAAEKEKDKIIKKENQKENQKKQDKIEKTNRVLDEIKAFLILALIIAIVVFGCWYWFTHIYNSERPVDSVKEEKKVEGYKTVKYTASKEHNLKVINDLYIIEYNDGTLYKIMDMKSDVLYEGELEFDSVRIGIDGNIYAVLYDDLEYENSIKLYKLENKELKLEMRLYDSGIFYSEILYYEDENATSPLLVGYQGFYSGYDEEGNYISETRIHDLMGKETKLEGFKLYGDSALLKEKEQDIITYNKQYIVVSEYRNGYDTGLYGLYDLEGNKVVISPQYEGLYTNNEETYIAIKNGKSGIINNKLKKIVNFEYDFIDRNKDYYVVAKNNKMAIMDDKYNVITKYDFDYQASDENIRYSYMTDESVYNTFKSSKVNDKYILTTNNMEYQNQINYNRHDTYIINKDGTYKNIVANEFIVDEDSGLIYSYDKNKKEYTFYDEELNVKCNINISSYDYDSRAVVQLLNKNTIVLEFDSNVYFDYETGEEIENIKDYSTVVNGVTVNYDAAKKEVSYIIEDKTATALSAKDEQNIKYFHVIDDDSLYAVTDKEYLYIEKGE